MITPTGPTQGGTYVDCEGTITFTWNYADCEGNNHDWVYTYTIELEDFAINMPPDQGIQTTCISLAVQNVPIEVNDSNGNPITPTGPAIGGTYVDCEGTVTYTWNYADCAGNNHDWVYTYTIVVEDFAINMPANEGSQIACASDAVAPVPPVVNDNCGNQITPTGPTQDGTYDGCDGTITFVWNYADCAGNNHDWLYTYTLEGGDITLPANEGSIVACASEAVAPVPPVVNDSCGNVITPTGPTQGGTYVDCEGTITYSYSYADCDGNNQDWVYIYTIEVEDFTMPSNEGSTVNSGQQAVEPVPPTVYDNCGNLITPTGPTLGGGFVDCYSFTITYTWNYADCEGNNHNWVYTYLVVQEERLNDTRCMMSIDFKAYPVPFDGKLNIEYKFEFDTKVTLEVFDVRGRLINTVENYNYSQGKLETTVIDMSRANDQVYFIQLTTNRGVVIKKVVSSNK
ncbi:hypothetical protein GCM10011312_21130 [Planktosalinus lacus]|uniref:Secretion system C-terminal sorting domain-containing protein n=1 Tax=Planktosalinus lacus TaxID=1526573 RepID=A0A8J2VB29_9FLAO|nr:T9SS type A sorting domain-containing protein [Planktosalinus lacus]GGD97363.1 hypothetical protein GCM10011312_21130 [Planktosalinus lacus]